MAPRLVEIHVADDPSLWSGLGFEVDGDRCHLGGIDVVLTGAGSGRGIHGWAWDGVDAEATVGTIPTAIAPTPTANASVHPNGAIGLFYVVLFGPSWAEAATALGAVGLDAGEGRPMGSAPDAMLRSLAPAGDVEIEVIGPPGHDPDRAWNLWGTIVEVADIDIAAAHLGDRLRPVKPAVQRGRRIATLDRSAGSSAAIALMGPDER